MSETTTQPEAQTWAHQTTSELLVDQLAPLFLPSGSNDIALAREAAIKAINSYHFRTQGELISVVQVIAFAMSTIRALGLATSNEIPLQTILRLQGNAVALNKSEHAVRRILRETPAEQRRLEPAEPQRQPEPAPQPQEQPRPTAQTTAAQATVPQTIPPALPPAMGKQAAGAFAALNAAIQGSMQPVPSLPMGLRASALGSSATDLLTRPASPPLGIAISRGGG